jgi:hypothetical protein
MNQDRESIIMATEKRRSRRSSATSGNPRTFGTPRTTAAAPAAGVDTAVGDEARTPRTDDVDWASEYSYVAKDLRQLFIVAAVLFAGLLITGFLL